jgi:hypothetical protein
MRRIIVVCIVILVSVSAILTLVYIDFQKPKHCLSSQLNQKLLCDGDIILRKGRSMASMAVCIADEYDGFSHIGIVKLVDGEPFVIHAVPGESNGPDKVKMDPLPTFLHPSRASNLALFRPDLPGHIVAKACSTALSYFENELLFDDEYSWESDSKLYCTELVIKAYESAGFLMGKDKMQDIDFAFFNHRLIMPSFIASEAHFKKITPKSLTLTKNDYETTQSN